MLSVRHAARRGRSAKVSIPFHESAHWWGNKLNGRRQHSKLPDMWVYRMKKKKKKRKAAVTAMWSEVTQEMSRSQKHTTRPRLNQWFFFSFLFFSEGRVRSQTAHLTQKQLEIHSPEPAAVTSPHRSLRRVGWGRSFTHDFLLLLLLICFQTRSDRVSAGRGVKKLLQTRLVFTLKGEMWRAASLAAALRRRGHRSKVWGGICAPTWLCNSPRAVRGAGSTRAHGTCTATRQERHSSNWNWTSARGRTDRDYTTAHSPLLHSLQQEKTPFLSIHAHPHTRPGEQGFRGNTQTVPMKFDDRWFMEKNEAGPDESPRLRVILYLSTRIKSHKNMSNI